MADEFIPVNYEELKQEAYYQVLNMNERFMDCVNSKYPVKREAIKLLGVNPSYLSRFKNIVSATRMYKYCKSLNINFIYVLEGMSRYEFEPHIEMHLTFANLIKQYDSSLYMYQMPRQLTINMCCFKKHKVEMSLTNLYIYSRIYRQPMWWLMQDDTYPIINPKTRIINNGEPICQL